MKVESNIYFKAFKDVPVGEVFLADGEPYMKTYKIKIEKDNSGSIFSNAIALSYPVYDEFFDNAIVEVFPDAKLVLDRD